MYKIRAILGVLSADGKVVKRSHLQYLVFPVDLSTISRRGFRMAKKSAAWLSEEATPFQRWHDIPHIPATDNEPGAPETLLKTNKILRGRRWPAPFDRTRHEMVLGDARDLKTIPNAHASNRRNARELVKESIDLFRTIHLRHSETDGPGLEALGVIVIEHDNINFYPDPPKYAHLRRPTQVAPMPPSLPVGDPLSYESMIQRICTHYTHRFGSR